MKNLLFCVCLVASCLFNVMGYATDVPMVANPTTGLPMKAPFLKGTFVSATQNELIILNRSDSNDGQPISLQLNGPISVYGVDRQESSLSNLKNGDKLKIHFQKNGDGTMTALMIHQTRL